MNQITHAAFVAAFVAKHGVHPSAFKMEKRGDAWKAKMEVLDSLAQVPDAPERRGSVRGVYPFTPGSVRGVYPFTPGSTFVVALEPTLGDFGAAGADSVVACALHETRLADREWVKEMVA